MQVKPPRPVLNRRHPLARGLVGAWPLFSRGAALDTVQHNVAANRYHLTRQTLVAGASHTFSTTPYGVGFEGTSGTTAGENGVLKTSGLAAVSPFPVTVLLVFKTGASLGNANNYLLGRWGNGVYDWLIATAGVGGIHRPVVYQANSTLDSYYALGANSLPVNSWHILSVSYQDGAAPPVALVDGVVQSYTQYGPNPGSYSNGNEMVWHPAFETANQNAGVAGIALWNYAMTAAQQKVLHADPWGLYRPVRRVVGKFGSALGLAGGAYYYRNLLGRRI